MNLSLSPQDQRLLRGYQNVAPAELDIGRMDYGRSACAIAMADEKRTEEERTIRLRYRFGG